MDLFSFDDDYVRRLREGDRETAAHFYSYFCELLHAKLRRKLRSPDAVEEVRQDVFVRVLKSLDQIKDGTRLGAFVNTTCNHVLLEHYRQESRAVSLEEQPEIVVDDESDRKVDAARNILRVHKVLLEMDEHDAAILKAIFLDEEDKDAICRRHHVDRAYLRVLVHRAKAKFRAAYLRRKSGRSSRY
jgi:RNA polymerase sigma-70 factor (ECF subfamily)